jgi:hypothetical protein
MSRLNPKNREEAFAHQLQDDVKMLMPHALIGDEKSFKQVIVKIEAIIKAYHSKLLRNACAKTQQKTKERNAYMEKHFPSLLKIRNPRKKMVSISSIKPVRTYKIKKK